MVVEGLFARRGLFISVSLFPPLSPDPSAFVPLRQSKLLNLYASAERSEMAGGGGGGNRQRGKSGKTLRNRERLGLAGKCGTKQTTVTGGGGGEVGGQTKLRLLRDEKTSKMNGKT